MQTGTRVRCDALPALSVPVVSFLSSQLPLFTLPPAISPETCFQRVARFRIFCIQFEQSLLSVTFIIQSCYRANSSPAPRWQHPLPACPLDHELLGQGRSVSRNLQPPEQCLQAACLFCLPLSLLTSRCSFHRLPHSVPTMVARWLGGLCSRTERDSGRSGLHQGSAKGLPWALWALSFSWNWCQKRITTLSRASFQSVQCGRQI